MTEPIIIILFLLLLINYAYFIIKIYSGLNMVFSIDKPGKIDNSIYISVIIPFRNETKNILNSLKSLELQKFPKDKYEVIYINDCSTDDSMEKILSVEKSSNIKVLSLNVNHNLTAYKKRAVQYGIINSIGNIIVTTDCDCSHGEYWLSSLISYFDKDTAMVAGPVIFKDESTFFNKLQKLEFAGLILAGAGLIGRNEPIICNAANLAYRREVFEKVDGFKNDMQLSSGDDELLMQRIASETNFMIKFCKENECVVNTEQNKNISAFLQQRKRWASKGLFYRNKLLIVNLILIYFFYCGLIIMPILSVFVSIIYLWLFILSFLTKLIVEYLVLLRGIDFLFNRKLLNLLLPAEIFQIPYIVFAGIFGALGNYNWKERDIKR